MGDTQASGLCFQPATTMRASEVIYNQIYEKIASGDLRPGDTLPSERELAEQFRRSRPSVREALRMLQQDGLLKINVGSAGGAVVQSISLKTVEAPLKKLVEIGAINLADLVEYRHINDRGCARLAAAHRTEEDIRAMQQILDAAEANICTPKSFQQYDIAFHTALAKASHNDLALLINDVIVGLNTDAFLQAIQNYPVERHQQINREIFESHSAILKAVIKGDPDEADQCVDEMIGVFQSCIS
jgi:GntR family transcriptional repressor for pyruvate dehydrogenase complex